jgi:hypothetical protein
MLIDQVRENGNIDLVLDESVDLFGHAELFEPVCNLLHRGNRQTLAFSYSLMRRLLTWVKATEPEKWRGVWLSPL